MESFGLSNDPDDAEIITYFETILNNDDKYYMFMKVLRNYKNYAGFQDIESRMIQFLNTLKNYAANKKNNKEMLISTFRWIIVDLEIMKENSTKRRNLIDDFNNNYSYAHIFLSILYTLYIKMTCNFKFPKLE